MRTAIDVYGPLAEKMAVPLSTPAELTDMQARFLKKNAMGVPKDFVGTQPDVFLDVDKVTLRCPCGEYVPVEPKWALACCFSCGNIFRSLVIPPELMV